MNVYDWDKTIYDGDSSIDFYKFNLRKDKKLSKLWLKQTKAAADYKRGKISKTEMKTVFYEYFKERNKLFEEINTYFIDEIKKPL